MRTLPLDRDTLELLKDYIKRGGPVNNEEKRLIFGINRHRAWQIVKERAERIISRMVVSSVDVTEEQAGRIYERELKRISLKFTHMRYHSFLVYFGMLKRLNWVETTTETEPSAIQDNYPPAPEPVYYRLTREGIAQPARSPGQTLFLPSTQKLAPAT